MTSLTSIQAALTDVEAAQKTGAQIGHHPQLQAQLASAVTNLNTAIQEITPPVTPPVTPTVPAPVGIAGNWVNKLNTDFTTMTSIGDIYDEGWWGDGESGPVNQTYESAAYDSKNISFDSDGICLALTQEEITVPKGTYQYTGCLISSNPDDGRPSGGFEFLYGIAEARIYLPGDESGQIVNWPAFWQTRSRCLVERRRLITTTMSKDLA
jgi:hypothetical protein